METSTRESNTPVAPVSDPLHEVDQRLVGIHASIAESLSTDPTVVPWVEREIMDVLRFIQRTRAAQSTGGESNSTPGA